MKTVNTSFRAGAVCFLLLVGLIQSCKKEPVANHTPGAKAGQAALQRTSDSDISVIDGIPRYATMEVYTETCEQLISQMEANAHQLSVTYADITTDDEQNEDIAWQVWEETFTPLRNFESYVGFDSKSKEDYVLEKSWLTVQGEELNTETYPNLTGADIIQKTMMNKDGNFIVGNDLYHIEADLKSFKVEDWMNLNTASKTYIGQIFGAIGNLDWAEIENLFTQLDDHIVISNNRGNPDANCKTNKKDGFWIDVDSKTKYAQHSSMAYDLIKTSAYHEIRAYAKILKKWVPALTKLKVGIQLFHKKTGDCSEKTGSWTGDNNVWRGSFAFIQNNFWGVQRAIDKPVLNGNGSAPFDGFYGSERVKDLGILRFSPLRITY